MLNEGGTMGLNISKGNMYDFVTHTWNTVKGRCYHDCSYCYMKRWGNLKEARLDEKEFKTDLGNGNFIFVGSSCDMFANDIPYEWVKKTLNKCKEYDNKYLFQTKNPAKMVSTGLIENCVTCITLETNRIYSEYMKNSPTPNERVIYFENFTYDKYITIEPIMDFDLLQFVDMLKRCEPIQINIGADSGNNHLPEPDNYKIDRLINELMKFTKVKLKKNIKRIFRPTEII